MPHILGTNFNQASVCVYTHPYPQSCSCIRAFPCMLLTSVLLSESMSTLLFTEPPVCTYGHEIFIKCMPICTTTYPAHPNTHTYPLHTHRALGWTTQQSQGSFLHHHCPLPPSLARPSSFRAWGWEEGWGDRMRLVQSPSPLLSGSAVTPSGAVVKWPTSQLSACPRRT